MTSGSVFGFLIKLRAEHMFFGADIRSSPVLKHISSPFSAESMLSAYVKLTGARKVSKNQFYGVQVSRAV